MLRDPNSSKDLELYANRCLQEVQYWLKAYRLKDAERISRIQKLEAHVQLLNRLKAHTIKNKNGSIAEFYQEYNRIESSHHFLDNFAKLAMAQHSDNNGWVRNEVEQILRLDLEYLYFDLPSTLDQKFNKEREDLFFHFFSLWGKAKNELVKHFILQFSLIQEQAERYQNLRMNLGLAWSLSDIREFVKSVNFGRRYPGFWYRILNRRSSDLEVDHFLSQLQEISVLKKLEPSEYWVMLGKIPYQGEAKDYLVTQLMGLWKEEKSYYKYLVLKFLEDEQIKKEFEQRDISFKRALFQIKKEAYTKILQQNEAEQLMIYELLKLGDYQEAFLDKLLWL